MFRSNLHTKNSKSPVRIYAPLEEAHATMMLSPSISSGKAGIDPSCWRHPQLLCLLHHTFFPPPVHHPPPVNPGVFLLLLLLSAGCCCLLRPATHAPILFRQDTNLQTLLALRSNLSGQGISCPMCSGEHLQTFQYSPCLGPVFIFFTCCILQVFLWRSRTLCTPTRPRLSSPRIRRARAPPTSIAARLDQIQAPMKQVKQSALRNLPLCLYHLYSF